MDVNILLNVILLAIIGWFLYSRFAPVKGLQSLTAEEVREKLDGPKKCKLIDVRETHEFQAGHIPGAVNIPLSGLRRRTNEIIGGEDIILYCRSGMRSKQAAKILRKKGAENIAHLSGGLVTWKGKIQR